MKDAATDTTEAPAPKHNTGAKVGVALAFSTVGAKLAIPGMVMDANSLFPKGTKLGEKFKRVFSKEALELLGQEQARHMQAGRGQITAMLMAMKWSMILSTVGSLVFGVVGWMRADRIQDSKDIVKHPIESTKIILGFKEPKKQAAEKDDQVSEAKAGKYATSVMERRAEQAELER